VFGVTLQGRFFAYHWIPLLPTATLLGAVSLHSIRARVPTLAGLSCAAVILHSLAPIALEEARFAAWVAGRMSTDTYYDGYGEPGDDMKAVRWLRETGQPGDMYVFGWQGGVAWLSGRQIVSRFGFSMPLMIGEGSDLRVRYRQELLAALMSTPPRYILVGPQSERIIGTRMTIDDFPELAALVNRNYSRFSIRIDHLRQSAMRTHPGRALGSRAVYPIGCGRRGAHPCPCRVRLRASPDRCPAVRRFPALPTVELDRQHAPTSLVGYRGSDGRGFVAELAVSRRSDRHHRIHGLRPGMAGGRRSSRLLPGGTD
jgi:hypothetical protein